MKKLVINIVLLFVCLCANAYDFEVDGVGYTVTSFENFTVAVDECIESLSGKVEIPNTISYSNKQFTVTGIKRMRSTKIEYILLPSTLTQIEDYAFLGSGLVELVIPNSVTNVGKGFCKGCKSLTSVSMSNNVSYLGHYCFQDCICLQKFEWHPVSNYSKIGPRSFENCKSLTSFTIPKGVSSTGGVWDGSFSYNLIAFNNCTSLDSLYIEDSNQKLYFGMDDMDGYKTEFNNSKIKYLYLGRDYVKNNYYNVPPFAFVEHLVIGDSVCSLTNWPSGKLKTLEIGSHLESLHDISDNTTLEYIRLKCTTPPTAQGFSNYNYINTKLLVPKGSKSVYESTNVWKNFWNIEEEEQGGQVEPKQCASPTIEFKNKKLLYFCETEGALCHSSIKCNDAKSYEGNEIKLGATYDISVYATAEGHTQSEVINATLYWLDATLDPSGIQAVQANTRGILVHHTNGFLTLSGLYDNEKVYFYDIDGKLLGETRAYSGEASYCVDTSSKIVFVKIGNESIKVALY